MADIGGIENRQKIRVEFRAEIVITFSETQFRFEADSRNLSLNGIFIETDADMPSGEACRVQLFLSGTAEPVELTMDGQIARKDSSGFAVSFKGMDLDTYTQLKHIVRYNSGDPDLV